MDHHNNFVIKYNLATPLAIIIAGILISASICWVGKAPSNTPSDEAGAAAGEAAPKAVTAVDSAKVKTAGVPYIGEANAKVTFAFWSDYQCPFCKRFQNDAIEKTISEYVKSGKVKILFKDFAFLGEDSQTAAIAARAVWEVNSAKFYDWHKAMFTKQDNENGGWGNKDDVIALTKTVLGESDANKVASLMTSKLSVYQKAITADKAEGGTFGITGTPGSIIGKTSISGAQSYATVKAAIDKALGN